eukprot:scaffold29459_cov92-Amphora_coffeaeformis.AAC.1
MVRRPRAKVGGVPGCHRGIPGVPANGCGAGDDEGSAHSVGEFGGTAGDGDGLVEEPEEPFDNDRFVVPSEGGLAGQVEGCAHGFEMAEEGGASVGGNEEAEANTKEDLFHECGGECGRVEGDDF